MTESTTAHYPVLNRDSASELAQPILENVQKAFGKIPNAIGTMANAPLTLKSYAEIGANFAKAGFRPVEQQIIFLAVSVENECAYCIAAHSTALKTNFKVAASVVDAIRAKTPTGDTKYDALIATVRAMVQNKGYLPDETRSAFLDAGYSPTQLIDLLSAIAMKTITNYFDHLTRIELDDDFKAEAK
ncbi:MAG: hypothetical protein PWP23_2810 [Candidatus Sumerlaeota bacterium]|nr:hypothetical protein [Candidatus Sumerlaeota bacterium]